MSRHQDSFLGTVGAKQATAEHDFMQRQESDFRLRARRNQLLAQWAAPLVDLGQDEWKSYLGGLIDADFSDGDKDDALVAKLLADLRAHGVPIDEAALRAQLGRFAAQARMERDGEHPLGSAPRQD